MKFPDLARYTQYRYKGWDNGIIFHNFGIFGGATKNLEWYFAGDTWPSMKFPQGFRDLYNQALSTTDIEPEKVQKVMRLIFDEAMVMPLGDSFPASFIRAGVHDLGLYTTEDYLFWTPENAWLEK